MEWKEEDLVNENSESGNEMDDESDSNSNHDDDNGDMEQTHIERVYILISILFN